MLKEIYPSKLEPSMVPTQKEPNKIDATIMTQPLQTTGANKNYSLNNLKANYLPISFGSSGSKISDGLFIKNSYGERIYVTPPDGKITKYISKISPENILKGEYYDEFADNLAILLGSSDHAILTTEKDVNAEIFVQNFAKKIKTDKYTGLGFQNSKTNIILIEDPIEASIEAVFQDYNKAPKKSKTVNEKTFFNLLTEISEKTPNKKIVFIKNFNEVLDMADDYEYNDIKTCLSKIAPNLSIVGFIDKPTQPQTLEEDTENFFGGLPSKKAEELLKSTPIIELNGLSTSNAIDFLKKNPKFKDEILSKYKEVNLKISDNALSELVEKAATTVDGSLPNSALKVLNLVAAAKASESKSTAADNKLIINTTDIKNFFNKHSKLVDMMKPIEGQFKTAERISTRLSDVGGIGNIREDIDDLLSYLKNPQKFVSDGNTSPKGFLLTGSPGTGKTLLARAIAGETNTPFIATSGSEFVEKYVGVGASRIRELVEKAKTLADNAANKTAIIFIDEIDAIGKKRSGDSNNSEAESTLNQLLVKMDGFDNKESKTHLIFLAATNREDILDDALKRPGRFDAIIKIPNPETDADRLEILKIHAKKLNFANESEKTKNLEEISKIMEGMSPAEMAATLQKAKKVAQRRQGDKNITYNDLVEGFLQVIAGPRDKTTNEIPLNDIKKTVRHEGGHAVIIDALQSALGEKISFITLNPRGNFLGAVFNTKSKSNYDFRSVILSAATSYAGGIAEPEYKISGHSAGVRQDAEQATEIIGKAITEWTLGVNTPPLSMKLKQENGEINKFSEYLLNRNGKKIDKDMELFSTTAKKIANMLIEFHSDFLDKYVNRFETNYGKGGCDLSGKEFHNLRQAWLVETGKIEQEKHLLKQVDNIIDAAFNSNKDVLTRTAKKLARVVR